LPQQSGLPLKRCEVATVVNDSIGQRLAILTRHLGSNSSLGVLSVHPSMPNEALEREVNWAVDHHNGVKVQHCAMFFSKKGNGKDHNDILVFLFGSESNHLQPNCWMRQRVERRKGFRIAKGRLGKGKAIEATVCVQNRCPKSLNESGQHWAARLNNVAGNLVGVDQDRSIFDEQIGHG
jgi:hypothetical protein